MTIIGEYNTRTSRPDTAVAKNIEMHKSSTMSTIDFCDQFLADITFHEIESINDAPMEEYLAQWNEDEEHQYPPFTGQEFLRTHDTIDDHPYAVAFRQFLDHGIDPDTANLLAFGEKRFDLISDDLNDPLRQIVVSIFDRFAKAGYWSELGELDYHLSSWKFCRLE